MMKAPCRRTRKSGAETTDESPAAPRRYQGFSLDSVSWGYREIFAQAIEDLFRQGCLGPRRAAVTARFFELMKRSRQSGYDHLLRQFLGALHPRNHWIMSAADVFRDVVETGAALAESRIGLGIRFFQALAAGQLGGSPPEMRNGLRWLRNLHETDGDLASAFLDGHAYLAERLRPAEMESYLATAVRIHGAHPESGCAFLRGRLSTSEVYIRNLTRECRLADVAAALRGLIRALSGQVCDIHDLSRLDSDELLEHGTRTLTLRDSVYLPERCRHFPTAAGNRNWYELCAVVAAAMLAERSFPIVHGLPRYSDCRNLAGQDLRKINLFRLVEYARVLRRAVRQWPGSRRLIAWGLRCEPLAQADEAVFLKLLTDAIFADGSVSSAVACLRQVADGCADCRETARRLGDARTQRRLAFLPGLGERMLSPLSFISDFMFPTSYADPARRPQAAQPNEKTARRREGNEDAPRLFGPPQSALVDGEAEREEDEASAAEESFFYDEWDFRHNAYRTEWCQVRQSFAPTSGAGAVGDEWQDEIRRIGTVFERLKPDVARRVKRQVDGDRIDLDGLLTYLVERTREPAPTMRFYEQPRIVLRDLAALLLLDLSGSTGSQVEPHSSVLDIEKKTGILLGRGLAALGDPFAVCGFHSYGREKCRYFVFKTFAEPWSQASMARIMGAQAGGSTRMGAALRHAGRLLDDQPARRRLIVLATDGRPMDHDYDPTSRYAQHDVRMACEENARRGIHTFAISTDENSQADMEIMFPRRRFALMQDIRQLPKILPRLYIQTTF
jgi:hypothetical protein